VFGHRHTGEILEQLNWKRVNSSQRTSVAIRGILSTIYVYLNREMTAGEVETCFRDFYGSKRWVRVFAASNLAADYVLSSHQLLRPRFLSCDDGRRLVLVSCLDNLLKGAAGQPYRT